MEAFAGIYIFFLLIALLVGILWIFMPFAVFGTKPILREISQRLANIEKQNAELIAARTQQAPSLQR